MKKTKFLTLTVFVLLFSILLTSCNSNIAEKTINSLFNNEYDLEDEVFTSIEEIPELAGYSLLARSNENIAILSKKADNNLSFWSYKVYNLLTKSVVLELCSSSTKEYSITSYSSYNLFVVREQTNAENSLTTQQIAYDLMGNELSRSALTFSAPKKLGEYILFDNRIYRPNYSNGRLEEITEIDSFAIPDFNNIATTDKYIYSMSSKNISVYDTEFSLVYYFEVPSYITSFSAFVLNDGKLIGQGRYQVEDDSKDYDFYTCSATSSNTVTAKYKVYQVLIDPATSTVKEVDLGCMLSSVKSAYELNKQESSFNVNGIENVAVTYPIVDKKIDSSSSVRNIVIMDNSGKISESLKLIDGQSTELPQMISTDRFLVRMLNGTYTLIDRSAKIIASNINSATAVGSYIVSNDVIYDLDMNLIYDTRDASAGTMAEIVGMSNTAVFVSETDEENFTYFMFKDGSKKQIGQLPNNKPYYTSHLKIMKFGYSIYTDESYKLYNFESENLTNHPSSILDEAAYTDDSAMVIIDKKAYLISK